MLKGEEREEDQKMMIGIEMIENDLRAVGVCVGDI